MPGSIRLFPEMKVNGHSWVPELVSPVFTDESTSPFEVNKRKVYAPGSGDFSKIRLLPVTGLGDTLNENSALWWSVAVIK